MKTTNHRWTPLEWYRNGFQITHVPQNKPSNQYVVRAAGGNVGRYESLSAAEGVAATQDPADYNGGIYRDPDDPDTIITGLDEPPERTSPPMTTTTSTTDDPPNSKAKSLSLSQIGIGAAAVAALLWWSK